MVRQLLACVTIVICGGSHPHEAAADPLAHTFSIVARDAVRGEIGMAVLLAPSRTPRRR
jgi:hypothetical protein